MISHRPCAHQLKVRNTETANLQTGKDAVCLVMPSHGCMDDDSCQLDKPQVGNILQLWSNKSAVFNVPNLVCSHL